MVRAIIYQKQLKEPQIVPIVEQAAYFQLYSDQYVILFEDEKGRRYVSSVSYRLENLMKTENYLDKCMPLAPDELPYIISYFEKKPNYLTYGNEDEKYFTRILFAKELDATYQADMAQEILRYYQTKEPQAFVTDYLKLANYETMPQAVRQYMMEMLVENRMYDQAYSCMELYGMDQFGMAAKVTLASYKIRQLAEEEEADEKVLLLAANTFANKKYNDSILDYLCRFYNGPSQMMLRLWRAAREFEIPTFELEERILVQMLYAQEDLTTVENVFAHYYEGDGRDLVILAYISARAHAYFVQDTPLSEDALLVITDRYEHHMELNDACCLALLKSLAQVSQPDEKQYEMEDALLAEYTCRNMNFAFYKKLDKRLVHKYHLYDKVFLEYRTNPKKHVVLHYSRDEDGENFVKEDMPDVYDGIFVKQFVLFFGEMVQYYITEEYGNQVEVTQSSRLTSTDVYSQKDESRYHLLNEMLMSETLQDEKSLYHNMKQYAGFDEVTKKVFKLI